MVKLGLKLVGYGGVEMMMEEEGNPQATMEAWVFIFNKVKT